MSIIAGIRRMAKLPQPFSSFSPGCVPHEKRARCARLRARNQRSSGCADDLILCNNLGATAGLVRSRARADRSRVISAAAGAISRRLSRRPAAHMSASFENLAPGNGAQDWCSAPSAPANRRWSWTDKMALRSQPPWRVSPCSGGLSAYGMAGPLALSRTKNMQKHSGKMGTGYEATGTSG
jgi:hypothetical protein